IEASIRSLSRKVAPTLLQGLVRQGVWSPLQGLAHVRQITDEKIRAESLIALGQVVPQDYLDELVAVGRQVEKASHRSDALVGLVVRLPQEQQAGVLEDALAAAR